MREGLAGRDRGLAERDRNLAERYPFAALSAAVLLVDRNPSETPLLQSARLPDPAGLGNGEVKEPPEATAAACGGDATIQRSNGA